MAFTLTSSPSPRIIETFVARLGRLSPLTAEEKTALVASLSRRQYYPARRDIVPAQTKSPGPHLILSGVACRYATSPSGHRHIIGYLFAGDLCDARASLLGRTPHALGALSTVETAFISNENLAQLLERCPALLRAIWSLSALEDSITRQWLLNIGHRTALERLAHLLCETFERLHAVDLVKGDICPFPITQSDVADALALTPIHINRTLMTLRRAGLISLQRGNLQFRDLDGLQAIAGFNPEYLQPQSLDMPAHARPAMRWPTPAPSSPAPDLRPPSAPVGGDRPERRVSSHNGSLPANATS